MRRLWFALLAVLVLLVVVAMPCVALAQTGTDVIDITTEAPTWLDLGTVVGAALFATLVARVLILVAPLVKAQTVRVVMLCVSVASAELVALTGSLTLESGVVAFVVGLMAALAAMKGYETYKHGLNAEVSTPGL
jgi:hypothetical protein